MNPVKVVEHKANKKKAERNILLFDISKSMDIGNPSARLEEVINEWNTRNLSEKELKSISYYTFSDSLKKLPDENSLKELSTTGLSTNIALAVKNSINREIDNGIRNIVIFSDGKTHDRSDLTNSIALARNYNIPISVMAVGKKSESKNISIQNCIVDNNVRSNSNVNIKLQVNSEGISMHNYSIYLLDEKEKIISKDSYTLRRGINNYTIQFTSGLHSSKYKLNIQKLENESTVVDNSFEFDLKVSNPKVKVLYMEGSYARYQSALNPYSAYWPAYNFIYQAGDKTGRVDMDIYVVNRQSEVGGEIFNIKTNKSGYPKSKEELSKYDVIICSDINRYIFSDDQLKWTRELVSENGVGFCMIGGITSFGTGGWDKTSWEKMIPVDMKTYGRSHISRRIKPTFPKSSLNHPIMQLGKDEVESKIILFNHPLFLGTNLVSKAKPGATTLAYWKENKNMPLICVQSYGKGRTMAFTSDAAGGWGEGYQNGWGESSTDNNHYNKFWGNAILWLAGNRVATKDKAIAASTDKIRYYPNDIINISAKVLNTKKKLDVRLNKNDSTSNTVSLKYNPLLKTFSGYYRIPKETKNDNIKLILNSYEKNSDNILSTDTLKADIVHINNELRDINPDIPTLVRFAESTGGKLLETVSDIEKLFKKDNVSEAKITKDNIPIWDKWPLWILIVVFLSIEWIIRKFA